MAPGPAPTVDTGRDWPYCGALGGLMQSYDDDATFGVGVAFVHAMPSQLRYRGAKLGATSQPDGVRSLSAEGERWIRWSSRPVANRPRRCSRHRRHPGRLL